MTVPLKAAAILFASLISFAAWAGDIRVAVTTSFHISGLADVLLPKIEEDLDLKIDLLIVGTGQALRLGRAGDVDAVLVHSELAEIEFVDAGFATHRREIMSNDFVLVGPVADPAGISDARTTGQAMMSLASGASRFVSRGDDSGTHRKELMLWAEAGLNPSDFPASWYRAIGAGMGAALNAASAANAYTLCDRASWLNFGNKGELRILFSGDPALFNQYSYLPVNPEQHPHVKSDQAQALEDWLASPQGQSVIGSYKLRGQVLFTPNAGLAARQSPGQ